MKGNSTVIIGVKAKPEKNASHKHLGEKELPKISQTFSFIQTER